MAANSWSSFWKKPNDAFNRVMKVSTDFFYDQLTKRYPVTRGEAVLDYGCGPGLLIRRLVASGAVVTGADINESFLEHNRENFPGTDLIRISEDPAITVGILSEQLSKKQFDRIILLSIVQYFRSEQDVEDIIKFLKSYLKPKGKLIVADVLHKDTSSVRDAIGIFIQCIRKGRIIAFARFILYLTLSDYRKISKNNKLLLLSDDFIKRMALSCRLKAEELRGMTPHPTRTNYIFTCE